MNVLYDKPLSLLDTFLDQYSKIDSIDIEQAKAEIKARSFFEPLTEAWYSRLREEGIEAAYEVYDYGKYYQDVWVCFQEYSRRYLRDLQKPKMPNGQSFVELVSDAKSIVDIGCGISYSTIALKQTFPGANVYGLNLPGTKQWKFGTARGDEYGFSLVATHEQVQALEPSGIDIVFASEYFEHIIRPLEEIENLCAKWSPKYFVIANAFNTWSIGHFEEYEVEQINGEIVMIDQSKMSRMFNNHLRSLGYTMLKTDLFNNKPNIWKRNDV